MPPGPLHEHRGSTSQYKLLQYTARSLKELLQAVVPPRPLREHMGHHTPRLHCDPIHTTSPHQEGLGKVQGSCLVRGQGPELSS